MNGPTQRAIRYDREMPASHDQLPPQSVLFPPVTLSGRSVTLVPLAIDHHDQLAESVRDGELWKLWYTHAPAPEEMHDEIERRLGLQRWGAMLPFTVIDPAEQRAVGMTSLMNIDSVSRRVEVGSTWYAQRVQKTALNTEAKLLLLGHAFETLDCIAVEFLVHFMNQASRRAVERLGAKFDGVLRNHSFAKNGTIRDTCVYSILPNEWPAVKANLIWMLEKPR
jgi:RimJ/RimL family protein N-acetyltransferase